MQTSSMSDLPDFAGKDRPDRPALFPCVLFGALTLLAVMLLAFWPKDGLPMAVVFAPGTLLPAMIKQVERAGGGVIDVGSVGNMVIAVSASDGFSTRLREQGAWLVMDGTLTAAWCTSSKRAPAGAS